MPLTFHFDCHDNTNRGSLPEEDEDEEDRVAALMGVRRKINEDEDSGPDDEIVIGPHGRYVSRSYIRPIPSESSEADSDKRALQSPAKTPPLHQQRVIQDTNGRWITNPAFAPEDFSTIGDNQLFVEDLQGNEKLKPELDEDFSVPSISDRSVDETDIQQQTTSVEPAKQATIPGQIDYSKKPRSEWFLWRRCCTCHTVYFVGGIYQDKCYCGHGKCKQCCWATDFGYPPSYVGQ